MLDPQMAINSLQMGLGRPLTEEEENSITQFHNGRSLQQLIMMPGWKVLMDAFEDHRQDAIKGLLNLNPWNKDAVLAAHAAAFAVNKTLDDIKWEVSKAIENSQQLPEILAQNLNQEPVAV